VHSDHKITFDTVISSAKTFNCPSIRRLLAYEVVSETEFSPPFQNSVFIPNSFSDISEYLERKILIMKLYKGEMKEHPFPRSEDNLRALATFRGAAAGVKYAEAFMVLKEIW
jgi:LmbE family N-acetylglucosaminyl deacetylase